MNTEKQRRFLISLLYYAAIVLGIWLAARYLLTPLMPFIIGFLIACLLHRPSAFIARKLHVTQKIPSLLLTAVIYILAVCVLLFAGVQIVSAVKNLIPQIPSLYTNYLLPLLNSDMEQVMGYLNRLSPELAAEAGTWFSELSVSIGQVTSSVSTTAAKLISGLATSMPNVIIQIVLTIVSTFFIAVDYERVSGFLKRLLPPKGQELLEKVQGKVASSIKIFLRSYTLIALMTFVELALGLSLLRIPYAIGIALVIAILDILPLLGTGLILLPWAAISALMGNVGLAIGLAVLYVVITVIRNVVEPRLVGQQMGLHPLATLVSMFLGVQLVGMFGMILFPFGLSLLLQFKKDGVIPDLPWMKKQKEKQERGMA